MEQAAIDLLDEHLPYELDMLDHALEFLFSSNFAAARENQLSRNMAIEAFWTHARNLNEFVQMRPGKGDATGIAAAADFTERLFPMDLKLGTKLGKPLTDRINDQVSHLRYERARGYPGKLDKHDMMRVREAIERAVEKFQENLTDDAQKHWKPRVSRISELQDQAYLAINNETTTSSGTNVITSVSYTGATGPAEPRE